MGSSGALEPFALEQQGNPFFFTHSQGSSRVLNS